MESQDASKEVASSMEKDNNDGAVDEQEHRAYQGQFMQLFNGLFGQGRKHEDQGSIDVSTTKPVETIFKAQPGDPKWRFIQEDGIHDTYVPRRRTKRATMPKQLSIRERRSLRRQQLQEQNSVHDTGVKGQNTSTTLSDTHSSIQTEDSSKSTKATQTKPTVAASTRQGFTTLAERRASRRKTVLQSRLHHLSKRLQPLVRVTTGEVHPAFPRNMLSYHLLSEDDLDSLAEFYHQRIPSALTRMYPCPVSWADNLAIEDKRRMFGRFIGLGELRSPVTLSVPTVEQIWDNARRAAIAEEENEVKLARKGRY